MPTRFCLNNIGDPSSMNISKATTRKNGDKITRTKRANKRLNIISKGLKCFN
jgi:hypothetical protein